MPTALPDDEPDLPAVTAFLTLIVSIGEHEETDAQEEKDMAAMEVMLSDMRVIDLALLGVVGLVAMEASKAETRTRIARQRGGS